ncbi:MAG: ornithine cyclodeaminase family protein [Rhodobacteraceae bacterium]|nr:ornithine cyclodeaminase family protein [Paracoccaceae bacterium]
MSAAIPALYLSEQDLAGLGISPGDVADCIEGALGDQAAGRLWTVPKSALMPGDGRYLMTTLSVGDGPGLTVVKVAMVSPRNPARGLPGIESSILLLDAETGEMRATMGGKWITQVRTAGLCAVMARRLANPDAHEIAFIGCGAQARSHLEAFGAMFPLARARLVGRGQANIDRLVAACTARGLDAEVCTPREAIEGADLVVTSITLDHGVAPFLDARWLKPGGFAAITDLGIPWVDAGMTALDAAFVDDRAQEAESGTPMIDPALICGDLAEVVTGAVPAAFDPGKRQAFLFRGVAIGDFAVAALAYDRAVGAGVGQRLG